MKKKLHDRILFLVLLGCAFLALAPVVMLFADFLKSGTDTLKIILQDKLYRIQFSYSLFYTLLSASLGLVNALPLALSIYLLNNRTLCFVLYFILFALFLPGQVTMLPNYIIVERLGLMDTPWALILSGIFKPYSVLLLSLCMRLMPRTAYEQFCMESDSVGALLWKVILPYLAPVILVCFTLESAQFWNMLDAPLIYLESEEYMPLSVGLFRYQTASAAEFPAAALLYLVPPVLLMLFASGLLYFPVRHSLTQRFSAQQRKARQGFRKRLLPEKDGFSQSSDTAVTSVRLRLTIILCTAAGLCLVIGLWIYAGMKKRDRLPQEDREPASGTEVILGIRRSYPLLEECIAAFNEGGYGYHVTLRSYDSGEPNTSEEAMELQIYTDLISENGPDIMVFDSPEAEPWTSAGGLTDLAPCLEESVHLSREDFVEGVTEAYTYEGKLLGLPRWVTVQTLWGKSGLVDETAEWTVSDMLALMEQYPDVPLTCSLTREEFLSYCLAFTEESLWEKQEQEEMARLRRILELAAAYPDQAESMQLSDKCHLLHQQEALLMDWSFVSWEIFRMLKVWSSGDKLIPVGYPAPDGKPRALLFNVNGLYTIPANASNKEGAWVFLEHFFAGDLDPQLTDRENSAFKVWGIPVLKQELEEAFKEEEQRTEYLGMELPPFEERQEIEDLLSMADVYEYSQLQILEIITEEIPAYFEGMKTLDDTLEIIQRRIHLYLEENVTVQ